MADPPKCPPPEPKSWRRRWQKVYYISNNAVSRGEVLYRERGKSSARIDKWDEELLDGASVIYCGVEGHPSPNYKIRRKSRDEEFEFVAREYFPY